MVTHAKFAKHYQISFPEASGQNHAFVCCCRFAAPLSEEEKERKKGK